MQWQQENVTRRRRGRVGRVVSACAAIAVLVAACGSDDDDSTAETTEATDSSESTVETEETDAPGSSTAPEDDAPMELTEITIGFPQLAQSAAIPLAIEQGYFADEGLEVNLNSTIANPAIAAAVVSGDLQAGVSAWAAVSNFATQDLPIKVAVGLGAVGDADKNGDGGLSVVALADGDIQTPADLAGKTVVLNSLGADPEATVRVVATNAGIDPDSINLQTVDLPEIPAALRAGRADAAVISEPFLTALQQDTDVIILGTAADLQPNRPGLNLIVSAEYAEEHPEVVEALQRALARAADYANANPDAVRNLLVEQFGYTQEIAEQVPLPLYLAFPSLEEIQQIPQSLADLGMIDDVPDLSALVLPAPSDLDTDG